VSLPISAREEQLESARASSRARRRREGRKDALTAEPSPIDASARPCFLFCMSRMRCSTAGMRMASESARGRCRGPCGAGRTGVGTRETVDVHLAPLADAVDAVERLALDGGAPCEVCEGRSKVSFGSTLTTPTTPREERGSKHAPSEMTRLALVSVLQGRGGSVSARSKEEKVELELCSQADAAALERDCRARGRRVSGGLKRPTTLDEGGETHGGGPADEEGGGRVGEGQPREGRRARSGDDDAPCASSTCGTCEASRRGR